MNNLTPTNTSPRRLGLLLVLIAAAMAMILGVSYSVLASARSAAASSGDDAHHCEVLANRIVQMQERRTVAGTSQLMIDDLAGLVEKAALAARMPAGAVSRIAPESDRRLGDSVYIEHPTELRLSDVTLRQLVDCLYALVHETPELGVRSIRLTAPRGEGENGESWMAEVSVSYLVYSPRQSKGGSH